MHAGGRRVFQSRVSAVSSVITALAALRLWGGFTILALPSGSQPGYRGRDKDGNSNLDRRALFHYTDEAGQKGILESGELHASLTAANPRDARYGDGHYLSDIVPGSRTRAQLSSAFIRVPWQGWRFTHYLEIDVTGLEVVAGRDNVFVIPGRVPLDIAGRIVRWGVN
jgi:hypothetical protein